MDIAALASAMTGAQSASNRTESAAAMMKINVQAEASIAQMVEAAAQNANRTANLANGVGGALDISV
jgi:hypothetical protein